MNCISFKIKSVTVEGFTSHLTVLYSEEFNSVVIIKKFFTKRDALRTKIIRKTKNYIICEEVSSFKLKTLELILNKIQNLIP